jgi:hypothetical protein
MRRLALLSVLLALTAIGADTETAILHTFVEPWVAAIGTNRALDLHLLHPEVQACWNDRTRPYFDSVLSNRTAKGTTAPYRITKLAPWQGPGPLLGLPADGFSYPVQPTYELHLRFENSNAEFVRYLAPEGGKWYMVLPCPNEKGIAYVRDNIAKANAQKERAAQLVAELKDPLRSELLALLRQHQMLNAVKRYQQATGLQDFTLAVMVMNAIDPEHPLGNR